MTAELSESLVNGRFKVTERPNVAPGKCAVCGAVTKPVVDFGLTLDYYGAVVLCIDCITEAYGAMTATFPVGEAQVVPLINRNNLVDSGTINEYVHAALNGVRRLNLILAGVNLPAEEDAEGHAIDDASNESDTSGLNQASSESANEPGPYDIPSPPSGLATDN